MFRSAMVVAVVFAGPLAGPAWSVETLTVPAAVARGLASNPQIRAAERRIEAARARETQAFALPNPNFSLSVDQVPLPTPFEGNYMAGISQPLLLAGQREARSEAARLEREMAEIDLEVLRRELTLQIKSAYVELLSAGEGLDLARVMNEAAVTVLKSATERFGAGEVAQLEVLTAEVEVSRAGREVATAEDQVFKTRARLDALLARTAEVPVVLEPLPAPAATSIPPLNMLLARALTSRVELRQAEIGIQREFAQRRVAQTGLWTGTEASFLAGAVGGQPGFSTSLSLPIPLYRQQGEIAEAEANQARAEAQRDALRFDITLEVKQAYREATRAARQADLFAKVYVPQATRLVANARERYTEGAGSGLEVLEARRAQRETSGEFRRALLEYREAVARLERAVGLDLLH